MTTMTDTPALPFAAQLILSMPGEGSPATITVTLLPDDTIPVGGQAKALADCTLGELRAFANTLEADVWQAYDDITLLEATKEIGVVAARLDSQGKVGDKLEEWRASIVLLPESAPAKAAKLTKPAAKTSEAAKATPKSPAAKPKETSTQAKPKPVEDAVPAAKPEPAAPKEPQTTPPPVESKPKPAAKADDLADVAAAIAFPPPVKQEAIEEARPKPDARPHVPATIEPSEARVRVAGRRLPLGGAASAAVDVLMDEPALRAMQAHALSSLDREVAGVMVGPRPEKQPDGRYLVRIIDSIAAKYTVMQGASVTYTADSWRYLNDTLGERYPDETGVMVGWYHTHPGFGIFLSGMDLFIHQNFFTQIWHIAYVLDPRARTSGFFCWSRDKSRVNRYDFGWPDWTDGSW
jgi:proteasome lid subunit RPN8/RPN11